MSEHIISPRDLQAVKRQAKQRSRNDKTLSYMQHLDAVSADLFGCSFQDVRHRSQIQQKQSNSPISLYLQACQDAYLEL